MLPEIDHDNPTHSRRGHRAGRAFVMSPFRAGFDMPASFSSWMVERCGSTSTSPVRGEMPTGGELPWLRGGGGASRTAHAVEGDHASATVNLSARLIPSNLGEVDAKRAPQDARRARPHAATANQTL
jgi:hypothetical protein